MSDVFLAQDTIPIRNPNLQKVIFFDVDETLTDKTGRIPECNAVAIQKLSENHLVFLATALPYKYTRRKCKDIWKYLAGGAFAEGSDLRIFDRDFKKIIPLNNAALALLPLNSKYKCYYEEDILHKITVTSGYVEESADFNIIRDKVVGIVAKNADKLSGVLHICKELKLLFEHITVVGNGKNDVSMLNFFRNSIAVPNADGSSKKAASVIRSVSDI